MGALISSCFFQTKVGGLPFSTGKTAYHFTLRAWPPKNCRKMDAMRRVFNTWLLGSSKKGVPKGLADVIFGHDIQWLDFEDFFYLFFLCEFLGLSWKKVVVFEDLPGTLGNRFRISQNGLVQKPPPKYLWTPKPMQNEGLFSPKTMGFYNW